MCGAGESREILDFHKASRTPQMGQGGKSWPFISSKGLEPNVKLLKGTKKEGLPIILFNTKL